MKIRFDKLPNQSPEYITVNGHLPCISFDLIKE